MKYGAWCAALVVAVLGAGCGSGSVRTEESSRAAPGAIELRPVHWPALRGNAIGQIKTDANRTWVVTIVPVPLDGGNSFAVDPVSLAVRKLPVTVPFAQIFAGDGRLWGVPDDGASVVSIDPSTGKRESHGLPAGCGLPPDIAGVVRLGQLWVSCRGEVAAYKPKRAAAEHVHAPRASTVLGSTHGVWLLVRRSLIGIAGDAKGRRIAVPRANDLLRWQAKGNQAWALDSLAGQTLVRVNLASGAVRRFALETQGQLIDTFAVGRNDIWATVASPATLRTRPLLLRFNRAHPRRPLSRVDLSAAKDLQIRLTAGPSYLWVELFSNRQSRLFRATVRR